MNELELKLALERLFKAASILARARAKMEEEAMTRGIGVDGAAAPDRVVAFVEEQGVPGTI